MKRSLLFLLTCAVVFTSGCGYTVVTSKPNANTMTGLWVPDGSKCTCPAALILNNTRLLLNPDGTFLAENFPKQVSLGQKATVSGRWSLKSKAGRWSLDLPWETPSKSILDGAPLIRSGEEILVEIWIGDRDDHSRLVLRRHASITSSNPAASGNGAARPLFHAKRLGRAVPEQRCWYGKYGSEAIARWGDSVRQYARDWLKNYRHIA